MTARRNELSDLMVEALRAEPFTTAAILARRVGTSKTRVNNILYSQTKRFTKTDDGPPRWAVNPALESAAARGSKEAKSAPSSTSALMGSLHQWQIEALVAWQANGCRGIVNAVTGAGKTRLALAAIEKHRSSSTAKTAIIVPTIELLRQWTAELKDAFPGVAVGALGDGKKDTLSSCEILVAVVNSASEWELGLEPGESGLLVGDECHRLASPTYRLSLEEGFERRLGLSATHERMDGLHEEVLIPYFGEVIYELSYGEAIAQDVIAHVKVATIGVRFTAQEAATYEQLTDEMREARRALVARYGISSSSTEFFSAVSRLGESDDPRARRAAMRYLGPHGRRRKLLSESRAKMEALPMLAAAVRDSKGTIAFTQTIESTDLIVQTFRNLGIESASIHSKLKPAERTEIFSKFASGDIQLISAPQVLDEGVDVPEADLAIIVASSSQRRQMVQRMGRVMRRKKGDRLARFVLLYVRDTLEDPLLGAQESFFDEVLDIADAVKRFNDSSRPQDVQRFLSPYAAD